MASWMNWVTGRSNSGNSRDRARDAIVTLRQHLMMLDKKEEHTMKRIADEEKKAKDNVTSNKRVALAALRRKKELEGELEQLYGRRQTLETQVNAIESANINLETMNIMRESAGVLKHIHGKLDVNKVDQTMEEVREQMEVATEISAAISTPIPTGHDIDQDELEAELEQMEQQELDDRLSAAQPVPVHSPGAAERTPAVRAPPARSRQEEEEEEELRQLQAELAA